MRSIIIFCLICWGPVSFGQHLQGYIDLAIENNPKILSLNQRYEIANEKVREVNSLPNTAVSAGYFASEPETRTGAQRARFSVSQMVPWFGTITARENYIASLADSEYLEIVIAKRKLALEVAKAYYGLSSNNAKQDVTVANLELLDTFKKLSLTSVEVGNATAVDVLKLQIRINELQQVLALLKQEYRANLAGFNQLLNRSNDTEAEVIRAVQLPEKDWEVADSELRLHPELIKYDKLYESVVQAEMLNKKESAPDIGFGLDYVPVSERPDMVFEDNGKDIVMPMVTLSIPLFNNKYRSISKQYELRQSEIEMMKADRLNNLKTTLAEALARRNMARITYETLELNLKQAKDAEKILIKNYETGTISFNDVLDIQELQLRFGMGKIEAAEAYYRSTALIHYLINE